MYTTLNRTRRQWHHKKCDSSFWRYYCGFLIFLDSVQTSSPLEATSDFFGFFHHVHWKAVVVEDDIIYRSRPTSRTTLNSGQGDYTYFSRPYSSYTKIVPYLGLAIERILAIERC